MAWLAKSIANSLSLHDDDDNETSKTKVNVETNESAPSKSESDELQHSPQTPSARGVKEDISELTKTLSRQFWGVASFLAPPPPPPQPSDQSLSSQSDRSPSKPSDSDEVPDSSGIAGIKSDFAEIGGKFKSGITMLSNHKAVSEITKLASNFLPFGSGQEINDEGLIGNVVGVTEEVIAFARNISMHPETWMDFPLEDNDEDDDSDGFDMSDAQQEHALAVEHLAPRLAALRMELCPGYMSGAWFWKIYFVLIHPRLSKEDALLLSTPQVMEARALLAQELKNRTNKNPNEDSSQSSYFPETLNSTKEEPLSAVSNADYEPGYRQKSAPEPRTITEAAEFEVEKHQVVSKEMQIVDKPVVEEGLVTKSKNSSASVSKILDDKYEDDADDWLKEETGETSGLSTTTIPLGNDEDVSFSDLEEEDEGDIHTSTKKTTYTSDSSTKDSREWVQLGRSSDASAKDIHPTEGAGPDQVCSVCHDMKESNDWLNLDDIDVV
ncbi:BSD domain [Dillenia turbinata]|uniref:BSD domain n=1 Tax=Dillenia turbinata TaxID=194707 RepID=A0AAN8V5M5_9MAGN